MSKKFNRLFFCTFFLFFTLTSGLNAFFGRDKYADEVYLQAGVKHVRRIWWFDEYYFDDRKISQFTAEVLVCLYDKIFKEKCDQNPDERSVYEETAKFISKLSKKEIKEVINLKILKVLDKFK